MKLAFTLLCENPARQTALTTFYREYLQHSLDAFPELEWIAFAGPTQQVGFEHPRLQYIRDYSANDNVKLRLLADHFYVGPRARGQGAAGLFTIGYAPERSTVPVFMGVNSLQHLNKENRVPPIRQLYRKVVVAYGIRRAALVITNSEFAASQLRIAHPACRKKLIVSHEGTQPEYQPVPQPKELEELQTGLDISPGYLLWVSNFYHYKQAPLLLEAYADLPASVREKMPLIMVGGDWDGGRAAAEAVIQKRGIQRDARILGWIDFKWLPVLYRHALAYVLPSREETFGRTTTEALASGTPCLLQDIPIMHEIAGDAAVIIDFNDRKASISALSTIFKDELLRSKLRLAGLNRAKQFSFKKMATERVGAALQWLQAHGHQ
jgi:alpha-1,3-rhamnosyl/mannosyltransferase